MYIMLLPLTPVSEITPEGEELHCAECARVVADNEDAVFWGDDYRCTTCSEKLAKIMQEEAEEFAREVCEITASFPKYDSTREFRCTQEQYEEGNRESYTRNSHYCHCRHACTNYDELKSGLERRSHFLEHHILYKAIRSRIDELVTERILEVENVP
jgi:hypothetical protein